MPILKDNFEILASGTLKTPTCKVIFLKLAASANIAFILGKNGGKYAVVGDKTALFRVFTQVSPKNLLNVGVFLKENATT